MNNPLEFLSPSQIIERFYLQDSSIDEPEFHTSNIIRHFLSLQESEKELKDDSNTNNNFMKMNDIKFNLYPLYIDWKKLEKNNAYFYKIFARFGYFGIAVYSLLKKVRNDITHRNILAIISSFFYDYFYLDKNEEINAAHLVHKFIKLFPDINEIFQLIKNKIILFKEIPMFIIVMKIFEIYYLYEKQYENLFQLIKHEFILNSYIKEDEYFDIYQKYFRGRVDLIFRKIAIKNGKLYKLPKNKSDFINHLKKIYRKIEKLRNEEKNKQSGEKSKEDNSPVNNKDESNTNHSSELNINDSLNIPIKLNN